VNKKYELASCGLMVGGASIFGGAFLMYLPLLCTGIAIFCAAIMLYLTSKFFAHKSN
jgi:hypothetical protein